MLNFKSLKWCFGIAMTLGLTACMEMQGSEQGPYPERMNTRHHQQHQQPQRQQEGATTTNKHTAKQKTYASKDPTQQATPGPSRKAAPQLPVIQ